MNGIHPPVTAPETALLEQAAAAPMLAQVEAWASVNSGSRNLTGLAAMATTLADAFSALPGAIDLIEPDPVETVAVVQAPGQPVPAELIYVAEGAELRLAWNLTVDRFESDNVWAEVRVDAETGEVIDPAASRFHAATDKVMNRGLYRLRARYV